jgi:hypothetical protein
MYQLYVWEVIFKKNDRVTSELNLSTGYVDGYEVK